jgi:hypothetical protein
MTNRTWIGGGNDKASNPNDWSPTGAPQPGDTLTISSGTMYVSDDNLAGDTLDLPGKERVSVSGPRPWGAPVFQEALMPDEPTTTGGRSYRIGDVGAGARVAQGVNISWVEGIGRLPEGESLKEQFGALLARIAQDTSLDEDSREIAVAKSSAIAEGLVKAHESPGVLRRALLDAKSWFGTTTKWIGSALADIIKSEAAQKTIGTVTEATTKAAIDSFRDWDYGP